MKAVRRVYKLMSRFPKIFIILLIVGFIVHLAIDDCIVTPANNDIVNTVDILASATTTQWTDSGLTVSMADRLTIKTVGNVFLCPINATTTNWYVDARVAEWVNIGYIYSGDEIQLKVGAPNGSYSGYGGKTYNNNAWDNNDDSYGMINGVGLLGVISPNYPPSNNPGSVSNLLDLRKDIVDTIWGRSDKTSSVTANGGYHGNVNATGTIYLHIADCDTWSGCRHDNYGGYTGTIKIIPQGGCAARDGGYSTVPGFTSFGNLQAVVSTGNPNTGGTAVPINVVSGQYNPAGGSMYPPAAGKIWVKVNDGVYTDNNGSYNVHVAAAHQPTMIISGLITDGLINPVRNTLFNAVKPIYEKLVQQTNFIAAIRAALVLYIILYCVMFITGVIQPSQLDLVIRVIKIGVLLTLISPQSWYFFSNYLLNAFIYGGVWLLNNMTGAVGTSGNPFMFLDKTIGYIFRQDTILKMMAVAMALPLGLIYIMLIIEALCTYVLAVCKIILGFMMSLIGVALLLVMAPFFISFILFHDTQELFKKWISLLFRFTLEPIIAITGIVIINEMLVIALHGVLDMSVCWKCVIGFSIPGYGNLFCIEFWAPWGFDNDGNGMGITDLTFGFANIMTFEVLTVLLKDFVEVAPRIAAKLTTTSPVTGTNFVGKAAVATGNASKALTEGAESAIAKITQKEKGGKERSKPEKGSEKGDQEAEAPTSGEGGGGGGGEDK